MDLSISWMIIMLDAVYEEKDLGVFITSNL